MFEKIKALAEERHAGFFRKAAEGENPLPYIVHPEAVVQNILSWGEQENSPAIGIGWGHDLLEDTSATYEEILAASDKTVAEGIRLLTCGENCPKRDYLRQVSLCGNREVLLVKIADRIQNTRDFVKLRGKLRAFRYLHEACCIFEAVQNLPSDSVLEYVLAAWQELDQSLRNDARLAAIRGCLIGGAVGDALGAPVEFFNQEEIFSLYGPYGVNYFVECGGIGRITDDTQMTLFTAEGILRGEVCRRQKGSCDFVSIMRYAYLRWLKTQGGTPAERGCGKELNSGWLIQQKELFCCRAPGMTCISALENSREPKRAYNNSKGCGSVMRMAPAGLFFEPEKAYDYGCKFSALTHGHPTGFTAGGAFAMLIAELLTGKPLTEALETVLNFLDTQPDAVETAAALRKAVSAKEISEIGEGWVAEEALAIAVFCALKYPWSFEQGVSTAVNITGDSDSTGAIAGNILGVINGEEAIPAVWKENLREYRIVSQCAADLWKRFEDTPKWREKYPDF